MTSEAIVIGVNKYKHLQPLEYAQQDAKAMAAFLKDEAKFDHVYYFAEDAEPINGVSMEPTQNNLRRILETRVAKRGLGDGDNFWFFFSGHGMRDGERDFLMPIDGYAENVAASGISTAQVAELLRACGADNVVMILDACRKGGRKDGKGIGDETREGCRQTGVISLFSCSPNQFSYELPTYQQGAFTKVLLKGLRRKGKTVEQLDKYLQQEVSKLVRECLGDSRKQHPETIAPISKSKLILIPKRSRAKDLNARPKRMTTTMPKIILKHPDQSHVGGLLKLQEHYPAGCQVDGLDNRIDQSIISAMTKAIKEIGKYMTIACHHNVDQEQLKLGRHDVIGGYGLFPISCEQLDDVMHEVIGEEDLRPDTKGDMDGDVAYLSGFNLMEQFRHSRPVLVALGERLVKDLERMYQCQVYTYPLAHEGLRLAERMGFENAQPGCIGHHGDEIADPIYRVSKDKLIAAIQSAIRTFKY
jgi:hypothetical protein